MSELRWTLLILGVVFIAALSWWERRRPRQAFAPRLRDASLAPADRPRGEAQRSASGPSADPTVAGEPWIGEAGLSDVVSSDMAFTDTADTGDPVGESGLHACAQAGAPGPLEQLPTLVIPNEEERLALEAAWDAEPPEPRLVDPEAMAAEETPAPMEAHDPIEVGGPSEMSEPSGPRDANELTDPNELRDPSRLSEPTEPPAQEPVRASAPSPADPASSAGPNGPEIFGAEGVGAVRIVEPELHGDGAPPVEPIVDWPPEESRRILALRLVAPQTERFAGRALRLALAAEGFLLGKFSIFHKPDETNRAVLSAASLTRPGAFDLETMDSQRYGGLSLFAVLPGPKAPPQAFEELLATARNLNERLEGALQDERGGPLTPLRVAHLRDSLRAEAASVPAAAAHGA